MAFVDRKKQAHLWRTNPHPTPEQVVMGALASYAAGEVVDFASRVIAKAFAKFRLVPPTASSPAVETAPNVAPVKAPRVRKPVSKTKGVSK
jgi:hypothetical protein